ncbi:MAG: hypothetical protein O3B09_00215 [Proteobacteria bacterium]|nr:hypothetical protein [Pseudomonadota bacterium]
MFGISFFELTIIAILALIIIGPKELPELVRGAIRFGIKIKKMIKQAGEESGLIELKEEIERDMAELEEETTTIIDLYGNEHKVKNVSKLRGDKSDEELKAEIAKYNKINSDGEIDKEIDDKEGK